MVNITRVVPTVDGELEYVDGTVIWRATRGGSRYTILNEGGTMHKDAEGLCMETIEDAFKLYKLCVKPKLPRLCKLLSSETAFTLPAKRVFKVDDSTLKFFEDIVFWLQTRLHIEA